MLRQPLEDGRVTISRSAGKITLPCNFMLVAAMNPCPCGYLGDPRHECRCTPTLIQRYRSRISGPLLDRIDLHIEAPAVSIGELRRETAAESSAAIRERVEFARQRQRGRFAGTSVLANARMSPPQLKNFCAIDQAMGDLLQQAMEQLSLSARAFDRILKVARTIADLAGADRIATPHLLDDSWQSRFGSHPIPITRSQRFLLGLSPGRLSRCRGSFGKNGAPAVALDMPGGKDSTALAATVRARLADFPANLVRVSSGRHWSPAAPRARSGGRPPVPNWSWASANRPAGRAPRQSGSARQ